MIEPVNDPGPVHIRTIEEPVGYVLHDGDCHRARGQLNDAMLTAAGNSRSRRSGTWTPIHTASAIRIETHVFVTTDVQQAAAARTVGRDVVDRFN